jgi:hypothetical protein
MAEKKKWSEMSDEEREELSDEEALDSFYGEIEDEGK